MKERTNYITENRVGKLALRALGVLIVVGIGIAVVNEALALGAS